MNRRLVLQVLTQVQHPLVIQHQVVVRQLVNQMLLQVHRLLVHQPVQSNASISESTTSNSVSSFTGAQSVSIESEWVTDWR